MKTRIFHTVNCGLYFEYADTAILVDGLHTGSQAGFSDCPAPVIAAITAPNGWQMPDFQPLQNSLRPPLAALLFTHRHADHYDPKLVSEAAQKNPGLQILIPAVTWFTESEQKPGWEPGRKLGSYETYHFTLGAASVVAFRTVHEGQPFAHELHVSYLVSIASEHFFIAGDACLDEVLARIIQNNCQKQPCLTFINPYQLLSLAGRQFLSALAPQETLLYHLPFPEDDRYLYYRLAEKAIRECQSIIPTPGHLKQMSWLWG